MPEQIRLRPTDKPPAIKAGSPRKMAPLSDNVLDDTRTGEPNRAAEVASFKQQQALDVRVRQLQPWQAGLRKVHQPSTRPVQARFLIENAVTQQNGVPYLSERKVKLPSYPCTPQSHGRDPAGLGLARTQQ